MPSTCRCGRSALPPPPPGRVGEVTAAESQAWGLSKGLLLTLSSGERREAQCGQDRVGLGCGALTGPQDTGLQPGQGVASARSTAVRTGVPALSSMPGTVPCPPCSAISRTLSALSTGPGWGRAGVQPPERGTGLPFCVGLPQAWPLPPSSHCSVRLELKAQPWAPSLAPRPDVSVSHSGSGCPGLGGAPGPGLRQNSHVCLPFPQGPGKAACSPRGQGPLPSCPLRPCPQRVPAMWGPVPFLDKKGFVVRLVNSHR